MSKDGLTFQLPPYIQFHPEKVDKIETMLGSHLDEYDISTEEHFDDDGVSLGITGVARLKGIDWSNNE